MTRTVKELCRSDVLVNNAAFQVHASQFEDLTARHFDETLTSQYTYFFMAQAAVKHMVPESAIVTAGSVTGPLGSPGLLDYSMTKGGINAFTKSLASHFVPPVIRVNAVAPGSAWRPLNPSDKQALHVSEFGAGTPTSRPVQPDQAVDTPLSQPSSCDAQERAARTPRLSYGQNRCRRGGIEERKVLRLRVGVALAL